MIDNYKNGPHNHYDDYVNNLQKLFNFDVEYGTINVIYWNLNLAVRFTNWLAKTFALRMALEVR